MIESSHNLFSISRQCDLFSVSKSTYYYKPVPENEYNLMLMQEIDKQYLDTPFYGKRLMTASLIKKGFEVGCTRVSHLMKKMCIEAMYPKSKRKIIEPKYGKFPYLLKDVDINAPNYAWGTDITYIPLNKGYIYLVVYLDLYSRYVLSWRLSNSLETSFCIEALEDAFKLGRPLILNSDQGVQFTSEEHIIVLLKNEIQISMSGKGRCFDNILVERFWRSIKYEEVYLKQYVDSEDAFENIRGYISLYNDHRPHSSLNYRTPSEVYLTR